MTGYRVRKTNRKPRGLTRWIIQTHLDHPHWSQTQIMNHVGAKNRGQVGNALRYHGYRCTNTASRPRGYKTTGTCGDPAVLALVDVLNEGKIRVTECAEEIGVGSATIYAWIYNKRTPSIVNIRAALNALGYDLTITRMD